MSLVLKGINLPEGDTAEVIIRIQPNGEVRDSHGILLDAEAKQISTPHGRLIDERKVLLTNLEIFICKGSYKDALKLICEKLDDAPTILESEE